MNIALDLSPLTKGHFLQHRVRGTGFYTENLKNALASYFPKNTYTYFSQGESVAKNTDIVHYPYFEPFFVTLPIRNKFTSVVTVHDLTPLVFPNHFPPGLKGKLKWLVQKSSLSRVQAVITDSDSSKNDITRFTGIAQEKIHTIYLAAGNNFTVLTSNMLRKKKLIEKYSLPEKYGLYVGDITWNKNIPRLIQAIKQTTVPLVLVGKAIAETEFDKQNPWNSDRIVVQNLLHSENNNQIHSIGYVNDIDLVSLYNYASVFIMPSLYEGFGLPVLEAMACGCPVIISPEGSLKEVAGDAAYYVNAYDSNDIAHGIEAVFTNKNLQKELSVKGIKRAASFSWKKTAEQTLHVYESLM